MSDLVERLRLLEACETELAHECDCPPEATANWKYAETCRLAAAEIERLRAALRPFAGIKADDGDDFSKWPDQVIIKCEASVREIKAARAALGEKHE